MTYARARLWLGILSVGFFVTLAAVLLALEATSLLPAQPLPAREELTWLIALVGFYCLLGLPFDFLGGLLLPGAHGRSEPLILAFAKAWARGALVQGLVLVVAAASVLLSTRSLGIAGGVAVVAALQALLLVAQAGLARLLARLPRSEAQLGAVAARLEQAGLSLPRLVLVESRDPGFTGSWVGMPGRETLMMPRRWLEELGDEGFALEVARRIGSLRSGARTRGLIVAFLWNVAGFALVASFVDGGPTTVAALVTVALGFTLWSFLGALLLPSRSRGAVLAADRFAVERGFAAPEVQSVLEKLDRLQDDEPERPPLVETIFHPIPSVSRRRARLRDGAAPRSGAWHAARMALYLSWAGFGLLGRAVHCNCGRPELWVLLPAD